MLLAEANQWPPDVLPYFGDADGPECHMAFHFPLMPRIWIALRREDRYPIVEIMGQTPEIPDESQWALFLRNHDELTLEMVTDEERDFMYAEYAKDARMRINVGIRRRLAPLVDRSRRRLELLNSLLFSMRGTPVVYYGDEIGMGDNVYLGDRNGVRTPMQWTGDRNAGFSRADVHALYAPLVADPVYGYQAVNVEAQERVPGSLLNWMKRIIRIRRAHPVFGRGSLEFLHPENRRVLAYLREHEGVTVLCVANLSRFAQYVELDLSRFDGRVPVEMIGRVHFPRHRRAAVPADPGPARLLLVRADRCRRLTPPGLLAQRWFRSKQRPIASVTEHDRAPLGDAALVILEVAYADGGGPDHYLVPDVDGREPRDGEGAWTAIVRAMADGAQLRGLRGSFSCSRTAALDELLPSASLSAAALGERRLGVEQSNTSVVLDDRLILKLYRLLEPGLNPDLEVSLFLADAGFADTPATAGAMTWVPDGGEPSAAAMLQAFVPSTGDAWAAMLGRLADGPRPRRRTWSRGSAR